MNVKCRQGERFDGKTRKVVGIKRTKKSAIRKEVRKKGLKKKIEKINEVESLDGKEGRVIDGERGQEGGKERTWRGDQQCVGVF